MLSRSQITHFANYTVLLAQRQVDKGGLPFSSIIVDQHGNCIGEGVNQVNELHDCTAHAEIQAIRAAAQSLGRASLAGSTLFASGEPCGLCYRAIRLAGITQVVVLLDRHEVKQLGYDYLWTYELATDTNPAPKVDSLITEVKSAPFRKSQRTLADIGL
ncbi:nucleoside deaminase [Alteromonas gilva]|uniref:Nucleoside deaminase n=1 Tax=Alteromonas gilva TaxID=2987522 RepID=A0ABT5L3C0_9ALTE|nr:nucleoside deaminase [Alteromonas gilva]MDC8830996.1 nucleoside deaminase [Alteromonas gilva]